MSGGPNYGPKLGRLMGFPYSWHPGHPLVGLGNPSIQRFQSHVTPRLSATWAAAWRSEWTSDDISGSASGGLTHEFRGTPCFRRSQLYCKAERWKKTSTALRSGEMAGSWRNPTCCCSSLQPEHHLGVKKNHRNLAIVRYDISPFMSQNMCSVHNNLSRLGGRRKKRGHS